MSNSEVALKSHRFDHDLNSLTTADSKVWLAKMEGFYGAFYPTFVEQIIRIGPADSLATTNKVKKFIEDPFIQSIQSSIDERFSEDKIENVNQEIELSMQYYNYHFPNKNIPEIIYYNSGFNYGIVTLENQVGIGLDFYIGKEDSLVKMMSGEVFHQYEKDKMDDKFMARDVMNGWLRKEFEKLHDNKNLLSMIISEGKLMYCLEAFFPYYSEDILMRYAPEEVAWIEKNKKNVWLEIAKQKVIFGTKNFDNQKWIKEGPFTNVGAIPNDSPARLGVWLGWQMVREYMNDHPEMTIPQLLDDKNYQIMLNSYKP